MKNINLYIILALLMAALGSCDTTTDVELSTDTVVVDAYLHANEPIDSVRITKSNSYSDTSGILVTFDELEVQIIGNNQVIDLSPIGNGYYQNLVDTIVAEQNYEITFEYNGVTVSSSTYIPAIKEATMTTDELYLEKIEIGVIPTFTQVDPVEIAWNNDEGDYFYVDVRNIEINPEYVNEFLATNNFPRPFRFISEPSIMNSYNIDPRREIQQFGTHEIIVYRVNPEYAALYATSGTTSNSITQPPTNIENGLGIFTGVSSDTLYLEVIKQ